MFYERERKMPFPRSWSPSLKWISRVEITVWYPLITSWTVSSWTGHVWALQTQVPMSSWDNYITWVLEGVWFHEAHGKSSHMSALFLTQDSTSSALGEGLKHVPLDLLLGRIVAFWSNEITVRDMVNHNWLLVYSSPKAHVVHINGFLIFCVQAPLMCIPASRRRLLPAALCLSAGFVFSSCTQLLSDRWNALSLSCR